MAMTATSAIQALWRIPMKGERAMSQVLEFASVVVKNLPEMQSDVMQGWIDNPRALQKFLGGLCPPEHSEMVQNISLSQAYNLIGMKAEYQEAKQKFDLTEDKNLWKLLMVKGLTLNKIVQAYRKAGVKMYLHTEDPDKDVNENQRDANKDGTYLVAFHRNVEADEENKNQSADHRRKQECQDITLAERLLLGLAYFLATGQHLDVKNVTQCQGSRCSRGRVPSVSWDAVHRWVDVDWYYSGYSYCNIRARSAVSPPAKTRDSVSEQA